MSQSQTNGAIGYVVIPDWVLRENYFESAEQLSLYIALANNLDARGFCHSSLSQLAHDAMCSRSTVLKNLKSLEEIGLITRRRRTAENGGHLSNEYSVSMCPTKKQKGM